MYFLFQDQDKKLYRSPDVYVLSKKNQSIEWGTELIIYPIYKHGHKVLHGNQTIYAMFNHEGETGTLGTLQWVSKNKNHEDWLDLINRDNKVKSFDLNQIIYFDLGENHPKYFYSSQDLSWYLTNIYTLSLIDIIG
jgi:hypothetical protein